MTILSINLTTKDPTYTWADIEANNRIIPAYLAEAKGDAIAAEEQYLKVCCELDDCDPNDETEHQAILFRIQEAAKTCDAADERARQAYARYNLDQALQLADNSIADRSPDFQNSPHFPPSPAESLLEVEDAPNVHTEALALRG